MSSENNITKTDECNAPPLTSEKKAQKSRKHRRKLVKRSSNEKSTPGESSSPLSTSKKKTPNSLKPKRKNMKKSSNENSKLGESSSALSPSKKKTLTSPNDKGEIVNKFSNEKHMPSSSKEIQNSQNAKMPNKKSKPVNNQNHKPEVANKGFHSGKAKEVENSSINHSRNKEMKNLGGFIFMCNGKTKRDCYHYRVMGVQAHKKDLVMGIKPGMKLFLFDFDVKLLYGIYKATSGGGMKLEPAAFGGGFPLQVRFEVHKDCLPLPESVFKKAIKESYDERTRKFKTELTFDQVKRLTNLFKPAPILHSNPQPIVHEPKLTVASSPLLLSEQEYRSYGLRGDRHKNLTPVVPPAYDPYRPDLQRDGPRADTVFVSRRPEQETMQLVKTTLTPPPVLLTEQEYRSYGLRQDRPPVYDPYKTDQERDGTHPDSVYHSRPSEQESNQSMQLQNPTLTSPPFFFTEQGYRSYGLRGDRPPLAYDPYKTNQERKDSWGPHDSLFLSEKDYRTYGLKPRQENPTSITPNIDANNHNSAIGFYQSEPYNPYDQDSDLVERYLPHSVVPSSSSYRFDQETISSDRVERLYSGNVSNELLNYNQNVGHGGDEIEYKSAPVSSRYAFAGPSVIHR